MKKLFHIRSDSFGNANQILAMKIGDRHCCFAIAGTGGQELNHVVYYSAEEINENLLVNLFVYHPELNNSFSKVMICYDFPQAVLIPQTYFKPEESFNILKSAFGFNDHPAMATQSVPGRELHIAYAIPKEINEWLNNRFPAASFFHHYSVHTENNNSGENFWVDFRTDEFSLIATKENKLLIAQTFSYSNPDDVIYYLLKTAQQFSLSTKVITLFLSGLIEKESALFKELYQYFLNIEFRNADWQIKSSEYPAHFFTSLNDLIKCAL